MKSAYQTLRSRQPALGPNDLHRDTPVPIASSPEFEDDTTIYFHRAHQARSEAFRGAFAYLAYQATRIPAKMNGIGHSIHTWLFTPFFSGGRRS